MGHKAILIWNFLFQGVAVRHANHEFIGSCASSQLPAGERPIGRRASLLMKSNERTRAIGSLKNIRKKKMIEQGGRCYYCGLVMWENALEPIAQARSRSAASLWLLQCTAEHLHPRSEGGADTADNIVAACWFCNSRRQRQKQPPAPEDDRASVPRRMGKGRWLAAQLAT